MYDEEPNGVFEGLRPGVPKREWEAADDNEAGQATYSQDVVQQRKRLCLPNTVEGPSPPEEATSSKAVFPLGSVSTDSWIGLTLPPLGSLDLSWTSNNNTQSN